MLIFLGGWVAFLISQSSPDEEPLGVLPVAMLVLFVLGGAATVYYVVAMLVNHTRLRVGPYRAELEHGPLPWRRAPAVGRADVARVEVDEKRQGSPGQPSTSMYVLSYVDPDGVSHELTRSWHHRSALERFKAELDARWEL